MDKILGKVIGNPVATPLKFCKDLGEITNLHSDLYFALNKKENEYVTFTTKGMLTKNNGELIIGGATASTETATYTAFSAYQGEGKSGNYYKQIYIFDSNHTDTFGIFTKGLLFDSNGTCVTTTYSRFVAFEDYINAIQLSVKDTAVFDGHARFRGEQSYFEKGLYASGDSTFAGLTRFQTLPQMIDYRGQKEADFMVIKDLGEITTQQQLDDLRLLPSGIAKFKCAYDITSSYDVPGFFKLGDVASGNPYEYIIETIVGTFDEINTGCGVQFLRSNNWIGPKPVFIGRRYYIASWGAFGGGPISYYQNGDELVFEDPNNGGKISSKGDLGIKSDKMASLGGNNVSLKANQIMEANCLTGYFNATNYFLFNKIKIMHPISTGVWADAAYGMTYTTVDNAATVTENIATYMFAQDRTYLNTVESLAIIISATITNADGLCTGIHFNTGDVAPSVSYTVSGETIINWQGTDCALDEGISVFAPQANMHYDIFITYMGGKVVGIVNGYVPATSNQ